MLVELDKPGPGSNAWQLDMAVSKEKSGSFLHRSARDASPLGKVGLKKGGVACGVGGDNRVISLAFLLY